ncbi:hypothetical protein HMPREF0591_1697 [Mycobacterium parascrofulaceum ATCC BAA-614]|uniref:Uncharacterized protein n=1 Tax=Mycobacterium parascrofulaceum ATCC BAA-614 TaxID=525368 RepID=D5P6A3_9MYCO|nr:hypothetical protein HMPREF0591_1697 [Mycobacterium parascrofulaceum ATCC BAA-614]
MAPALAFVVAWLRAIRAGCWLVPAAGQRVAIIAHCGSWG